MLPNKNFDLSCDMIRRYLHWKMHDSAGVSRGALNYGPRVSMSSTECSVLKLSFCTKTASVYMD